MENGILVVDDDKNILNLINRILIGSGYNNIHLAGSAEDALLMLEREKISVVLTDIRMPGMDGISLLEKIKEKDGSILVIIITAFGSIDQAVTCMKKGAFDFITKPFSSDIITIAMRKAVSHLELNREVQNLRMSVTKRADFMNFVGVSPIMQSLYEKIGAVAITDAPVLITGESGTGKELVAHAIHELSARKQIPLVSLSCPNIPITMLESELFGHVRGAFTDAYRDKKGLFEKANEGTIFLDEIGDITPDVQAKLLRVLQEGEILPLGSETSKKLDVRIITSTNKDLKAKVANGTFRQDLFYRINVINIHTPPLRERREDILRLSLFFLNEYAAKLSKTLKGFTPGALAYLERGRWDGNVRELKNAIYQGAVFGNGEMMGEEDLVTGHEERESAVLWETTGSLRETREKMLDDFEREFIKKALSQTGGNITRAARESGISRQSFQHLMKKHEIKATD